MTHSFSYYDQIARQSKTAIYLYIDIETIPSQDPAVLEAIRAKHAVPYPDLTLIKPDARLKAPQSIRTEITSLHADRSELDVVIETGDLGKDELKAAIKRRAAIDAKLPGLENDLLAAIDKVADDINSRTAKALADYDAAVAKAEAAIDEEYRRTALDASTGQIVCASAAIAGREVHCIWASDLSVEAERILLQGLFDGINGLLREHAVAAAMASLDEQGRKNTEAVNLEFQRHRVVPIIVAHHAGFDVRYIWQRAIVLGVTPPSWWPVDARPWDHDRVADTMLMWAGHGNRIGLDRLCRALGLPGKTGVDGSQVWDLVRDGRIDDVVDYCDDDVRRLRSVHRRLIGLPILEIDASNVPVEVDEGGKEAA